MRLLFILVYLSVFLQATGQKFEVLTSSLNVKGMAEDNGKIVLFGNGLIWINKTGEILEKLQVVDGFSISSLIDVLPDSKGGLWVLTREGLGRIDASRNFTIIFKTTSFGGVEAKQLQTRPDGKLFVLLKSKVVEVSQDNQYHVYFESTSRDFDYFQRFDIAADRSIYIITYQTICIIDPSKNGRLVTPNERLNFQDIQVTRENTIMVLEYKRLFELKNDELVSILALSQLSRGAQFYEGIFTSIDDYWLYANEGNAFHYVAGKWNNYIPPAGLKTGNLGESILKTADGEIWMNLNHFYTLRFDRQKWHKIDLNSQFSRQQVITPGLLRNGKLVGRDSKTFFPLVYDGEDFINSPLLPDVKMYYMTNDNTGTYYWFNDEGIFKQSGTSPVHIISGKVRAFEVQDNQLLYVKDYVMYKYENGKTDTFTNNEHWLGWGDELGDVKFYPTFNNQLIITSSRRAGLISLYNGKTFEKTIQIEGKMIGSVEQVFTLNEQTFLLTKGGSVARFDGKSFNWIYRTDNLNTNFYTSFISSDNTIWYVTTSDELKMTTSSGEVTTIKSPVEKGYMNFIAAIKKQDKVYDLYFGNQILRLTL